MFYQKNCRQNLIFCNKFLLHNEQKKVGYVHVSTDCFVWKKASIKSYQHHIPVQRSRAISSLSVVTWSRYSRGIQSDDYVVIVNQWHLYKFQSLITTAIFRVIISIDLITSLGIVVCYILLLPACKVEMRVKRQLFWQVGEDFTMWVTPAWCGWIGITASSTMNSSLNCYFFTKKMFFCKSSIE